MNINELKLFVTGILALAAVLVILIGCVTYYNSTQLKSELISAGKPTSTILYVHKLDDQQFDQLVRLLKTNNVENPTKDK